MVKEIYGFYVDRFTDDEWNDQTGQNTDRFQTMQAAFNAARDAKGMDAGKVWLTTYRYGVNSKLDSTLGLSSAIGAQIPQVLFATPDPSTPDVADLGGKAFFLAKLVKDQISQANAGIMLETVQALNYKTDPSGQVSFYDPTFRLFGDAGIGFNPSKSPGGHLIGLGLDNEPVLNRYGQIIQNVLDTLKKVLPWAIGGLILYEVVKKK